MMEQSFSFSLFYAYMRDLSPQMIYTERFLIARDRCCCVAAIRHIFHNEYCFIQFWRGLFIKPAENLCHQLMVTLGRLFMFQYATHKYNIYIERIFFKYKYWSAFAVFYAIRVDTAYVRLRRSERDGILHVL